MMTLRLVGLALALATLAPGARAQSAPTTSPFDLTADGRLPAVASTPPSEPKPAWDTMRIIREAQEARDRISLNGGVAIIRGSGYAAKLEAGTVEVTVPQIPDATWSYRLSSVRAGTDELYQDAGAAPPAEFDGAGPTLAFRHARVDELYDARASGLKQSFRIASPPADAGDLEVRGTLATNLVADAASGPALTFRYGAAEALRLTDAIVTDAAGSSLALDMSLESGQLVLRVPASWLATAAYPVTVDPLVGGVITVPSGTFTNAYVPAVDVAYNATNNEYVVVWNEYFGPGPDATAGTIDDDFDVFAARINAATGALIGGAITIDGTLDGSGPAAVSWRATGNLLLIAYGNYSSTAAANLTELVGRTLTGGTTTVSTAFTINSDLPGAMHDTSPDIATNGTTFWRVVWRRVDSFGGPTVASISGRDVTGAGTFTGGSFTVIDVPADLETRPAIAFNSGSSNFMIGWDTAVFLGSPGEIYVRSATTANPPVFGAATLISTGAAPNLKGACRLAANATDSEYLAVWQEDIVSGGTTTDNIALGRRILPTGAPAAAAFTIGADATLRDGRPDVCWNPTANMYLVVWHRLTITGGTLTAGDIMGSSYSGTTAALQESVTIAGTAAVEFFPACAASTTAAEALASWLANPTGAYEVQAQRYGFPAAPPPPPPPPPPGGGTAVGRDNPNGDQLFNDTLCGDGASSRGSWVWAALVLAALIGWSFTRR